MQKWPYKKRNKIVENIRLLYWFEIHKSIKITFEANTFVEWQSLPEWNCISLFSTDGQTGKIFFSQYIIMANSLLIIWHNHVVTAIALSIANV